MINIFQNDNYSKISNNDNYEYENINNINEKYSRHNNINNYKKIKNKIINMICIKKLNIIGICILFIVVFFLMLFFISALFNFNERLTNSLIKMTKISIDSMKSKDKLYYEKNNTVIKDKNKNKINESKIKEEKIEYEEKEEINNVTQKIESDKEEEERKNDTEKEFKKEERKNDTKIEFKKEEDRNNNSDIINETINNNINKENKTYINKDKENINKTNELDNNKSQTINIDKNKNIGNINETNKSEKINKNINKTKVEEDDEIIPKKEDIYKEEKFSSRSVSFNRARNFLDKSIKGILMHNKPFVSSENPKASAVIPVYNSKDIISRAVKSIQNQNILDLEIILVNDFSTDNTLSYLEKMQKEDPRIKIIKNKKNMGILYSRSIGALSAKGKYIFPLDNDDMFLDKDVFQTITGISDKGNFDIVEFKGIISLLSEKTSLLNRRITDISYSNHQLNLVLFQPELGNFPITPSEKNFGRYDLHTVFVWGKCIKTKIYKKALNKLGEDRYSRYMIRHEDVVATYILFNTAESYKFVGKYGIFHIHMSDSASKKREEVEMNLYNLYLTDVVIDFSKDTIDSKKLASYLVIFMLDRRKLYETINFKDYNYNLKLFISCLDRILNSKFVSDYMKSEIKRRVKKWKFLNYTCD